MSKELMSVSPNYLICAWWKPKFILFFFFFFFNIIDIKIIIIMRMLPLDHHLELVDIHFEKYN